MTPVKSLGTTHVCIQRDGTGRCHTASHSPLMVPRMSPGAMCERRSTQNLELAAPRKSCSTSPTKSVVSDDPTCSRMRGSGWKRRMRTRIKNYGVMLFHLSRSRWCRTSDLAIPPPLTTLFPPHRRPHRKIRNCLLSSLPVG